MEYGQESMRPSFGEYIVIPQVTEGICQCEPEFTKKTFSEPISPIVKDSNMWQLPIQLENVTEPENIQIQVDPVFRTVKITGKRQSFGDNVVLKQVIPLPENIDINQLKSVFKTQQGILLLTAPFLINQEQEGCVSDHCVKINEKDNTLSLPEYLHLLKTVTLAHGKKSDVECLKDTATGEWKIRIHLDTLGYQPENMQVLFHGKGRRLSVIGKRQVTGFGSNVFNREFLVPQYLDVDQLQWRVMNNGLVRIELPCRRGGFSTQGKFVRNIPTCTYY